MTILGCQKVNLALKRNKKYMPTWESLVWTLLKSLSREKLQALSNDPIDTAALAQRWRRKERMKKVMRLFTVSIKLSIAGIVTEREPRVKTSFFPGQLEVVRVLCSCLSQYQYQSWNCHIMALSLLTNIFHFLYGLMLGNHFHCCYCTFWKYVV